MGYFRPVSSFNIGKKGEHAERTHFEESAMAADAPSASASALSPAFAAVS
jgi:ribonucleoside-triphosphate reductase